MTAMEPKCLKMDLVEELLSIDETETVSYTHLRAHET